MNLYLTYELIANVVPIKLIQLMPIMAIAVSPADPRRSSGLAVKYSMPGHGLCDGGMHAEYLYHSRNH